MLNWRVNFVAVDAVLTERLKLHLKREEHIEMRYTASPEKGNFDIFILPAEELVTLTDLKLIKLDKWLPVIAYGSHFLLRKAFLTGCYDYLRDPWGPQELLIRLERLIQVLGKYHLLSFGSLFLKDNYLTSPAGRTELSYQESRILKMLLRQQGTVVTREALFYAIWDKPPAYNSRVIDVHISAIKKKLELHHLGHIIITVRRQGYLIIPENHI
jgi:hypothetical protein